MIFDNIMQIDESGCIHLFGFTLYTDDLLIIAILFFLYIQRVSDKLLYIALILLLLSN